MSKAQTSYICRECSATSLKWQGQCPGCGAWNALEPYAATKTRGRFPASTGLAAQMLADVSDQDLRRISTGIGELDRVLGGGLVPGAVVLIGGDPGIGKSTLLLQACAADGTGRNPPLYVTGEESLQQVALRARRLGIDTGTTKVLAATHIDEILTVASRDEPGFLIVDSVQTVFTEQLPSAPGSVNQLRECTAALVSLAKTTGIAVVLVGHVTKEGQIAGPRVLEHMVDVVLYFESDAGSRYRVLRAVKNRFGAANELGVFVMTGQGMRQVKNPSAIFLSPRSAPVSGSAVTAIHQGSRPLLVEVQALTDTSGSGQPRRLAVGFDTSRLALLLAVLHRHGGVRAHDQDVFLNVVGGIRISETSADLAALAATVSSHLDLPLPRTLLVFGEVGLAGEIRPVVYGEERLREAAKLGFNFAIAPSANCPRRPVDGLEIHGVDTLEAALEALREIAAPE